jgi:hypothetical protein
MKYGPNQNMSLEQWKEEQKAFAISIRDSPDREAILALRERAYGPKNV